MGNRGRRIVYITQFGGWWSATPAQWLAICRVAVAGKDFDYSQSTKALSGRPSTVRTENYTNASGFGRVSYYDTAGHVIHRPRDWDAEDWQSALDAAEPDDPDYAMLSTELADQARDAGLICTEGDWHTVPNEEYPTNGQLVSAHDDPRMAKHVRTWVEQHRALNPEFYTKEAVYQRRLVAARSLLQEIVDAERETHVITTLVNVARDVAAADRFAAVILKAEQYLDRESA